MNKIILNDEELANLKTFLSTAELKMSLMGAQAINQVLLAAQKAEKIVEQAKDDIQPMPVEKIN